MRPASVPTSLVAERAVRLLARQTRPIGSLELAREVLATTAPDETTATTILGAAFAGDRRLRYEDGSWHLAQTIPSRAEPREPPGAAHAPIDEVDRVMIFIQGERPSRAEPFRLRSLSALRFQADQVVAAFGGDTGEGPQAARLRREVLQSLDGAVPVIHDPPGALRAVERWLGGPLPAPISLRRLGQDRAGLPATHDLEKLVAHLGLDWRETEDPLEQADMLDACLEALRRPGEGLEELRPTSGNPSKLPWSRFAFGRDAVRTVPAVPGTYRFYDEKDNLIYVGKSKNLNRRIGSYFREDTRKRTRRVQDLLDRLHRFECEPSGSDLEAMLREAEQIRADHPERNVQRQVHAKKGRAARLRSILILEPAEAPSVLRAFLIREGRLIDRVSIGPRGGGLGRIRRALDDCFFSAPTGPTRVGGPDLDVEIVLRWLAAHRESVVAFDPTDLMSSEEVIERLRWFLCQGNLMDPDGSPILTR